MIEGCLTTVADHFSYTIYPNIFIFIFFFSFQVLPEDIIRQRPLISSIHD